ncbi:extracellular solute-binding protein [Jeotgalibacillus terrae]|uniref:Extracellular solute-binding protein n=1 Tax=Jeotgalibacillus terrae TaxID=587735 RepID=A0ABW5ZIA3_9BACL|nr:extracellular solute-binding protein [Jeotgalibacillus terrae]MBM7579640.1 raffinose/stachyose/melibiose transport system substrate-binding protein [Jeotgalibacillus terrae]
MNWKSRGMVATAASAMLILGACGGDTESSGGSGSNGDQVELTFWNIWTESSPQNEASKAAVERFMEENPDINIVQENIAHDQFKVKVKTQAAGRQLPDLVQVWPGAELTPLVEGELIQPIDDILDTWDGMISESMFADYNVDGTQYAVPANVTPTSLVYYNKDMLAEAGYDQIPDTYDEFKQLIEDLKAQGDIPITLGNKGQWLLQSSYISTIGDRMTGSDFLNDVLAGDAKFTDDRFVKAVEVIQEMAEMEAFNNDFNTLDNIQHRELFLSKEAAMMIDGAWSLGPIVESIEDEGNLGIGVFPALEGGDGNPEAVSAVTGTGIAINSELEGEELEAAQKFLESFYSEEYYTELLESDILVAADVEMPEGASDSLKRVAEIVNTETTPVYDAAVPVDLTDAINSGLQEVSIGTLTPEQFAKNLQDIVDSGL